VSAASDYLDGADVDTRKTVFSYGTLTRKIDVVQKNWRIPKDLEAWMHDNIKGNKNYAAIKLLEHGIRACKEQLTQGDFDIDELEKLPKE
jgi:hypothetical protein